MSKMTEWRKQYYIKHKDRLTKAFAIYNAKKQALITKEKLKTGCVTCGYKKNPAALAFHHINREDKVATNSRLSMKKFVLETSKCIVLCNNCHAEVHHPL